jgi:ubiquinone/menaquinone biosynthesis C-methylase UbiE
VSIVPAAKRDIYSGGYDPLLLQSLAKREAVREAAFLIPHLEPGMRVLDCGCGPGGITWASRLLFPKDAS